MTNANSPANAQALPSLDRRAALGSLAASALLAVPKIAKAAASDDTDVFAAINHVRSLLRAQEGAGAHLTALNRLLPEREDIPGLITQKADPAIFRTTKPEGSALDLEDVRAAQSVARAFRACGIDAANPIFGAAYQRLVEIDKSWLQFKRLWDETQDRLGYDEVEKAWDDAVAATDKAAKALLDLRPKTVAGIRAIMVALKDVSYYETSEDGETIQRFLLEAPALAAFT